MIQSILKKKIPSKNLAIEKMNQFRGIFQGKIVKKTLTNVKSGINAQELTMKFALVLITILKTASIYQAATIVLVNQVFVELNANEKILVRRYIN